LAFFRITASKKYHLARQAQLFTRKPGPFYPDFSWSYSTIPALILGHYFAPQALDLLPLFLPIFHSTMPHSTTPLTTSGSPLNQARSVMILTHGRGADGEDIMGLARELPIKDMAYLAATASGRAWYPNSFLAPIPQNEPGISQGIAVLKALVDRAQDAGIPSERIFLAGFSQGACLTSEFLARHPDTYGGALIFTGGLIGPQGTPRQYEGRLNGVPVFIGSSDVDPHVPLWRVEETVTVLTQMGAQVTVTIYPNMLHTINQDQLRQARQLLADRL
jgi:predicted esterase